MSVNFEDDIGKTCCFWKSNAFKETPTINVEIDGQILHVLALMKKNAISFIACSMTKSEQETTSVTKYNIEKYQGIIEKLDDAIKKEYQ